jgi:glycosyltransferase involved in cell wall biosynthesis
VSVIHLKRTPLFETVIPSKLFECMAMGIPVLHGVVGESAEIVTREGAGLCFEPENPTELAALISRLYRSPTERATIARSALAASSKYDRKAQAASMLETLVAIEAGSRRPTPASVRVQPPVR